MEELYGTELDQDHSNLLKSTRNFDNRRKVVHWKVKVNYLHVRQPPKLMRTTPWHFFFELACSPDLTSSGPFRGKGGKSSLYSKETSCFLKRKYVSGSKMGSMDYYFKEYNTSKQYQRKDSSRRWYLDQTQIVQTSSKAIAILIKSCMIIW